MGDFLYPVPQCHSLLSPYTKNHQADYPPVTYWPYMINFKLYLYFPGWVGGWVIIRLKANLSSNWTELVLKNSLPSTPAVKTK